MRKVFWFGLLLALPLSGLAARESLVVEAFEYPPIYQNSAAPGLACELVQEAFAAEGVDVSFQFVPVLRMIQEVADGKAIAGIGGSILFGDEGVRPRVSLSLPFLYVVQTFLYDIRRYPGGITYSSLGDLSRYRIGVLNGSGIMRYLSQTKGLNLVEGQLHEGMAKQLYAQRIDLWAIVDLTGLSYMNRLFPDEAKYFRTTKWFERGDITLAVSRVKDPEGRYQKLLASGLEVLKKNGTYRDILARYYGGVPNIHPDAWAEGMR